MIFKTNEPSSPSTEVVIDGVDIYKNSIVRVRLELEVNHHDMAVVTLAGVPGALVTDYLDRGIRIKCYQGDSGHSFYGYIVSVEPEYTTTGGVVAGYTIQKLNLVCLGASRAMSNKSNAIWQSTTLEQIVKDIATKYKFTFSVPTTNITLPRLTQSSETDWALLTKVCELHGLHFSVHGTHIHVWDPTKSISRQISYHEMLNLHERGGADMNLPGSILELHGEFGDPFKKANLKSLFSLNETGDFYSDTYQRPESEFGKRYGGLGTDVLNQSATTLELAEAIVRGKSRARDVFMLNLSTIGIAGVIPGGVVRVGNFSSKFDGLWYVQSVCQTITHDRMLTEARLISDALKDYSKTVYPVSTYTEPPNPVLLDGVWQSTYPMEEMYAL